MRLNGVGGLLTRITCILLVVFMVIPMSTDAIAGVFGFTYNIYNNLVAWGANWSGNIKSTTIKWSGQGISTVSNKQGWGVRVTITQDPSLKYRTEGGKNPEQVLFDSTKDHVPNETGATLFFMNNDVNSSASWFPAEVGAANQMTSLPSDLKIFIRTDGYGGKGVYYNQIMEVLNQGGTEALKTSWEGMCTDWENSCKAWSKICRGFKYDSNYNEVFMHTASRSDFSNYESIEDEETIKSIVAQSADVLMSLYTLMKDTSSGSAARAAVNAFFNSNTTEGSAVCVKLQPCVTLALLDNGVYKRPMLDTMSYIALYTGISASQFPWRRKFSSVGSTYNFFNEATAAESSYHTDVGGHSVNGIASSVAFSEPNGHGFKNGFELVSFSWYGHWTIDDAPANRYCRTSFTNSGSTGTENVHDSMAFYNPTAGSPGGISDSNMLSPNYMWGFNLFPLPNREIIDPKPFEIGQIIALPDAEVVEYPQDTLGKDITVDFHVGDQSANRGRWEATIKLAKSKNCNFKIEITNIRRESAKFKGEPIYEDTTPLQFDDVVKENVSPDELKKYVLDNESMHQYIDAVADYPITEEMWETVEPLSTNFDIVFTYKADIKITMDISKLPGNPKQEDYTWEGKELEDPASFILTRPGEVKGGGSLGIIFARPDNEALKADSSGQPLGKDVTVDVFLGLDDQSPEWKDIIDAFKKSNGTYELTVDVKRTGCSYEPYGQFHWVDPKQPIIQMSGTAAELTPYLGAVTDPDLTSVQKLTQLIDDTSDYILPYVTTNTPIIFYYEAEYNLTLHIAATADTMAQDIVIVGALDKYPLGSVTPTDQGGDGVAVENGGDGKPDGIAKDTASFILPGSPALPLALGKIIALPDNETVMGDTIGQDVTVDLYLGVNDQPNAVENVNAWKSTIDRARANGVNFDLEIKTTRYYSTPYGASAQLQTVTLTGISPDTMEKYVDGEKISTVIDNTAGYALPDVGNGEDPNIIFFYRSDFKISYSMNVEIVTENPDGSFDTTSEYKTYEYTGQAEDTASFLAVAKTKGYTSRPEAYAELKNYGAGSNETGTLKEDWEAMAGVPSTQQLYFAAGGSEFIVHIDTQYTYDEIAKRTYDAFYTKTNCEFQDDDDDSKTYTFSGVRAAAEAYGFDTSKLEHGYRTPDNIVSGTLVECSCSKCNVSDVIAGTAPDTSNGPACTEGDGHSGHSRDDRKPSPCGGGSGSATDVDLEINFHEEDLTMEVRASGHVINTQQWTHEVHAMGSATASVPWSTCRECERLMNAWYEAMRIWVIYTGGEIHINHQSGSDKYIRHGYLGSYGGYSGQQQCGTPNGSGQGIADESCDSGIGQSSCSSPSYPTPSPSSSRSSYHTHNDGSYWKDVTPEPPEEPEGGWPEGEEPEPPEPVYEWVEVTNTYGSVVEVSATGSSAPGNWEIVATWKVKSHASCGPCCTHVIAETHDTWAQTWKYDSTKIVDVHVWQIDQSAIEGISEIIGTSADINEVHSAQSHKLKAGLVAADIRTGRPTVFYNIALKAVSDFMNMDGVGGATETSGAGRVRYNLNGGWEKAEEHDEVSWNLGVRQDKCDGTASTNSNNLIIEGGGGHEELWAQEGFLYYTPAMADKGNWKSTPNSIGTNGLQYSETSTGEASGWQNSFKSATRAARTNTARYVNDVDKIGNANWNCIGQQNWPTNEVGYLKDNTDDIDKTTPEYQGFLEKRESTMEAWMITDFLILQTSSGDQSVIYFDEPNPPGSNITAESEIPELNLTAPDMWENNPTCASTWAPDHINVGGYNGKYTDVQDGKFNWATKGSVANHLFEGGDPAQTIIQPERPQRNLMLYHGQLNIVLTIVNDWYSTGDAEVFWANILHWTDTLSDTTGYTQNPNPPPYATDQFVGPLTTYDFSQNCGLVNAGNVHCNPNTDLNEPDFGAKKGFIMEATYSKEHTKVNDIIIHDPVSTENSFLISLPDERDQRIGGSLGADYVYEEKKKQEVCPLEPALCEFRYLDCTYGVDTSVAAFDFSNVDSRGYPINTVTKNSLALVTGFTTSGNNLVSSSATSLQIPFTELKMDYSTANRLKVDFSFNLNSLTGTQHLMSYAKYGLAVDSSGRIGFTDGAGTSYMSATHTIQAGTTYTVSALMPMGSMINAELYLNGSKVTLNVTGAVDAKLQQSNIGTSINIGAMTTSGGSGFRGTMSNLKITRMAGSSSHTDDCYIITMQHPEENNHHNHNIGCLPDIEVWDYTTAGMNELTLQPGEYLIEAWGAQGGNSGGLGGYARGNYTITSAQKLYAFVGGQGSKSSWDSSTATGGGYNGGGHGGPTGYGGGGASHVSTTNNPMVSKANITTTTTYSPKYKASGTTYTNGSYYTVLTFTAGYAGTITFSGTNTTYDGSKTAAVTIGGSTYTSTSTSFNISKSFSAGQTVTLKVKSNSSYYGSCTWNATVSFSDIASSSPISSSTTSTGQSGNRVSGYTAGGTPKSGSGTTYLNSSSSTTVVSFTPDSVGTFTFSCHDASYNGDIDGSCSGLSDVTGSQDYSGWDPYWSGTTTANSTVTVSLHVYQGRGDGYADVSYSWSFTPSTTSTTDYTYVTASSSSLTRTATNTKTVKKATEAASTWSPTGTLLVAGGGGGKSTNAGYAGGGDPQTVTNESTVRGPGRSVTLSYTVGSYPSISAGGGGGGNYGGLAATANANGGGGGTGAILGTLTDTSTGNAVQSGTGRVKITKLTSLGNVVDDILSGKTPEKEARAILGDQIYEQLGLAVKAEELYTWSGWENGKMLGFTCTNAVMRSTKQNWWDWNKNLYIQYNGTNPYIEVPVDINAPGVELITVKLSNHSNSTRARVYWSVNGSSYSDANMVEVSMYAWSDNQTLQFRVGTKSTWSGKITSIRIDPCELTQNVTPQWNGWYTEIQSITLSGTGTAKSGASVDNMFGGDYAEILNHNTVRKGAFESESQAMHNEQSEKRSLLDQLDMFDDKTKAGYDFVIVYGGDRNKKYIKWTQAENPLTTTGAVTISNLEIGNDLKSYVTNFGGLCKTTPDAEGNSYSLLEGTPGTPKVDYPIATYKVVSTKVGKGPYGRVEDRLMIRDDKNTDKVQLYVRTRNVVTVTGGDATGNTLNREEAVNLIHNNWTLLPYWKGEVYGSQNPIYTCNYEPKNTHQCNEKCREQRVLACNEPHHNNQHYASSSHICWKACCDNDKHKTYKDNFTHKVDSNTTVTFKSGNFINLDWKFEIFFPNIGDFDQGQPWGLSELTTTRGKSFINSMDTSKWTRTKRVRFNVNVIRDGQLYLAGEWITLADRGSYNGKPGDPYDARKWSNAGSDLENYIWGDKGKSNHDTEGTGAGDFIYEFYCVLANSEQAASEIVVDVAALNCPLDNDNPTETTNRIRFSNFTALHGGTNTFYVDVVGRIGNLILEDTGDYRFSNLFKQTIENVEPDPERVFSVAAGSMNTTGMVQIEDNKVVTTTINAGASTGGLPALEPGQYKLTVKGEKLSSGKLKVQTTANWTTIFDFAVGSGITKTTIVDGSTIQSIINPDGTPGTVTVDQTHNKFETDPISLNAGTFRVQVDGESFNASSWVVYRDGTDITDQCKNFNKTDTKLTFEITTAGMSGLTFVGEADNAVSTMEVTRISVSTVDKSKVTNIASTDSVTNIVVSNDVMSYYITIALENDAEISYVLNSIGEMKIESLTLQKMGEYDEKWIIEGIVKQVDQSTQNEYFAWGVNDIRGIAISPETNWLNTYGMAGWMNKAPIQLPLSPAKNNIQLLQSEPMLVGYELYMDIQTIGNYYASSNRLQVIPYYYVIDLDQPAVAPIPVDAYLKHDGGYFPVNIHGLVTGQNAELAGASDTYKALTIADIYNYIINLDWEVESSRRNYTAAERYATETVSSGSDGAVKAPAGHVYIQGNGQFIQIDGNARTFSGGEVTYDVLKNLSQGGGGTAQDYLDIGLLGNPNGRLPAANWWQAGQRWHFTVGLPSSTVFVRQGVAPETETVNEFQKENYVVLCCVEIRAIGDVWQLKYSHSDEANYGHTNGEKGPGDNGSIQVAYDNGVIKNYDIPLGLHPAISVFSTTKSSDFDVTIVGTH